MYIRVPTVKNSNPELLGSNPGRAKILNLANVPFPDKPSC
jgi:hypothetical protein